MPITQQQINSTMTFKKAKRDPKKGYKYVKKGGQGGKRAGAGRKSKGALKLKPMTLNVDPSLIATKEGRANIRAVCASAIEVYKLNLK
jgi:hypothetical protein